MSVRDAPPTPAVPAADTAARGADRRARRRRRRLLLWAAVGLGALVLAAVVWFVLEAYPPGGPGRPVVVEVTDGEPLSQIAGSLAAKGVIGSPLAFRLDLLVTGAPTVEPGWYELRTSSSFSSVKATLGGGPNATAVSVLTGETALEVAQNLASAESGAFGTRFLSLVRNGAVASPFQPRAHASLEGLLAPGTYVLVPGETPRRLVEAMAAAFVTRAAGVGLTPATTVHGLDAYQVVTAASIVEKEGYYASNMPKTATVVYNRLARGMPLQMDSTVLYTLGQDGGPVTHQTESTPSPYNTYLHTGLTPTPICIPSTQALTASLHPPVGPWLFFTLVSKDGTMAFSTTIAEQLANERLARERGLP